MFNLSEAFEGLPYWDTAAMSINTSEVCATRKLLQLRDFGTDMGDVARKFAGSGAPDLPADHFAERRRAVRAVQAWVRAHAGRMPERVYNNEWTLVLYNFEVARNAAKRNQDWGHLVFVDGTLTRYLLVMCMGPDEDGHGKKAHDHYFTVTKYHADRLMSLLQYVFHDGPQPNWVRATFTTSTSTLHPLFLDSVDATVPAGTFPPIYHATPATFTPALTESELERVESTMRQSRSWAKHVPPPAVRDAVLAREARPKAAHATWLAGKSGPEGCAYCGEVAEGKMPQCSVCKIVRYCNKSCQRSHWPSHRKYCKKAESTA